MLQRWRSQAVKKTIINSCALVFSLSATAALSSSAVHTYRSIKSLVTKKVVIEVASELKLKSIKFNLEDKSNIKAPTINQVIVKSVGSSLTSKELEFDLDRAELSRVLTQDWNVFDYKFIALNSTKNKSKNIASHTKRVDIQKVHVTIQKKTIQSKVNIQAQELKNGYSSLLAYNNTNESLHKISDADAIKISKKIVVVENKKINKNKEIEEQEAIKEFESKDDEDGLDTLIGINVSGVDKTASIKNNSEVQEYDQTSEENENSFNLNTQSDIQTNASTDTQKMDTQESESENLEKVDSQSHQAIVSIPNSVNTNKEPIVNTQANTSVAEVKQEQSSAVIAADVKSTEVQGLKHENTAQFSGRIVEAFSKGATPIVNAKVQILGTDVVTFTDESGRFRFNDAYVEGVLPVIITKENFLYRRVDLHPGKFSNYELIAENYVSLSAMVSKVYRERNTAFLFGELTSSVHESVGNLKVSLFGNKDAKVIYLDERGIPNASQESTSARGQFLVLNIISGTYPILILDKDGQEKAPHIIHFGHGEGVIRKIEMGSKRTIQGRILNASLSNIGVDNAQIQILGNTKATYTDRNGKFSLDSVYIDCSENNYLQMDKSGFYRNRLEYQCTDKETQNNMYVFSGQYIDGISRESHTDLKPETAIVVGHVSFKKSVKMQLWGPEEVQSQDSIRGKDFYFDKDGVLNSGRNFTSRIGNFSILDAPVGLSYIQSFSKDNRTLSFWPIYLSPSTISIHVQ